MVVGKRRSGFVWRALRSVKRRWLRSDFHFAAEIRRRRLAIATGLQSQEVAANVVLSLTSFPARISKLHLVLGSILTQSTVPEKIVVYLGVDEFPEGYPQALAKLVRRGVEIRLVSGGLGSYKKLIPALGDFPGVPIVTCDDDMFYPRNWFATLVAGAASAPGEIVCVRARRIVVDQAGSFAAYGEWPLVDSAIASIWHVPLGGCGAWYPPGALDDRVTDAKLFLRLAPYADDLWFTAMGWLKGVPCRLIGPNTLHPEIAFADGTRLWHLNRDGGNDRQLAAIASYFGITPASLTEREAALAKS